MYKKILTISLLIIILMSIFSVNCYASTIDFEFTFKDKGLNFPDISYSGKYNPQYFILFEDISYNRYWFYATESPMYISELYDSKYKLMLKNGYGYEFILDYQSGKTSFAVNKAIYFSTFSGNYVYPNRILYSSYDIYYNDELVVEAYGTTPLLKSVRSVKTLDSVLNETISILPITLTVVVGLVAIRKGISFTTKKIRNA